MTTQNTLPAPQPRAVRRPSAKRRAIIGILLGVLGFLLISLGVRERQRIPWIPVHVPIQLVPGERVQGQFRADSAHSYQVEIHFPDKSLDRLGAPDIFSGWIDWIEKRLAVHLSLTAAGGGVTDLGRMSCPGTVGANTCIVGFLRIEAGQTYTLVLEVVHAATEIRDLETFLEVTLSPAGRNPIMAQAAVFGLSGLIALGAALVMFLASLVAYIRKRRVMRSNGTA